VDRKLPWLYGTAVEAVEKEPAGGFIAVDGWDAANILDEGFSSDTEPHESFDSGWEAIEFAMGAGRYSDTNSFFYTPVDGAMASDEGFFNEVYCPRCVADAVDADLDDEIEPEINPVATEDRKKSFKHGTEAKEVSSIWYQCGEHPEVYLSMSESEYV
jgi:hypothetical protein